MADRDDMPDPGGPDDAVDFVAAGDEDAADSVDDGDLAEDALRRARQMVSGGAGDAVTREQADAATRRLLGRRKKRRRNTDGSSYSGSGPDPRDPAPVGSLFSGLVDDLGWQAPLAHARLMGQWSELVGADIAAHCSPVSLTDGDLRIVAESTAWAYQLRLMTGRLLAEISTQLPQGMVTKLTITGPSGPTFKRGPWSMHGGRGVRDTYG